MRSRGTRLEMLTFSFILLVFSDVCSCFVLISEFFLFFSEE